jgi:phosphoglycolate phosphatase-like HAD superfamily hydrolase
MPLDPARIQALCFDIDGTLSDTDDQFVLKMARWLSLVKFLFPHGDVRPFARRLVMATETPGNLFFGLTDRLGMDRPLARLGDLVYHLGLGRHPEPFVLVPGVRKMLDLLQPRYPLGIVTARGQRAARRFLEQFELGGCFVCVASAQTCRYTKPHPDPVLWAAAQIGVAPERCLMIGDTTLDIRAGKAAGAQTAGVLCGFGQEGELRRAGADVILDSTADLADILKREYHE